MKIIEALKKIKDLDRKINDLRAKVSKYCADLDDQDPVYGNPPSVEAQKEQIDSWLQSIHDSVKEILRLRTCIQRTNLNTKVTMTIGDLAVEHTISEWIHRRRDLAGLERRAWEALSDKGLQTTVTSKSNKPISQGNVPEDLTVVKIRRYFSPKEKDEKVELYKSEPEIIDAKLEVVNAATDLIEE